MGKGYQQDISKLKGKQPLESKSYNYTATANLMDFHSLLDARINGDVFLRLNETRLERSGVSLGFQVTLLNIIESLVCDVYFIKFSSS